MKLLEGKTAIITGASRGIGKAVALEFARQGANIAFTDLRYDEIAQETEKEIAALGVKAKMYASNAADFAATSATVDEIVKEFKACNVYSKEECKKCFARFYCSGGCNANNLEYAGSIKKPYKVACELEKKRLECAIMIKAALAD